MICCRDLVVNIIKLIISKIIYFIYRIGGINPFFNIFHHQYLATYLLNRDLKRKFKTIKGKLLDVGCGMKPYKRYVDNTVEYLGVDVYAESKADKLMVNGREIPYEDNCFDWIISTNAIEHIPELDFVIDEIKRVSKSDAEFLITIPFMFHEHGKPYDFRRFSRFGIEEYFKSKDFLILDTKISGGIGTYLVVGLLDWLDITLSSFRIGVVLKVLLAPIYLLIVPLINIFGIFLNKIDSSESFYSSVEVHLKKG